MALRPHSPANEDGYAIQDLHPAYGPLAAQLDVGKVRAINAPYADHLGHHEGDIHRAAKAAVVLYLPLERYVCKLVQTPRSCARQQRIEDK